MAGNLKLTLTSDEIANKSKFTPGQRAHYCGEQNPLIIIGEDDTSVWTILGRNGAYFGVGKTPENLALLRVD